MEFRMQLGTSVIIPVRNGAAYIGEAMTSVLHQLDEKDELIIVDDGSTDDTRSVITAAADSRVRVLATPRRGVSAARNIGLAAARGEFIGFIDHDDLWPAGRQEFMRSVLMKKSIVDAVFGRIRIRFEPEVAPSPKYSAMDGTFWPEGTGSGLYRRGIIDRVQGFAEELAGSEDVDFYIRLREAGMRIEFCEIDSLIYRRHKSNATNDQHAQRVGFMYMLRRKLSRARLDAHFQDTDRRSSLRASTDREVVSRKT
jgi:glycosyltransferase involved in cell wall biosynthesis